MNLTLAKVVGALVVAVVVSTQSYLLYGSNRKLAVADDNLTAAYDTTRTHLQDSLQASTRLALQSDAVHDSLSDLLRTALAGRSANGAALQILQVRFGELRETAQRADTVFVEVEGADTIRVVEFTHEGPPIGGTQTVRIRPREVTLDSRLSVSPFSITTGIGCDGPTPVFAWETPTWVSASFERGAVSPEVCRVPRRAASLFAISTGHTVWFAGGVAVGILIIGGVR